MAILSKNPFEGSFENLTTKIVKPAVKAVAEDVKESLGLVEEVGLKEIPQEEKMDINIQTARNLQKIDAEIARIRQEKQQRQVWQARQAAQTKRVEGQRKKEEVPVWLKAIRGKKGSGESKVNAGG